MKNIKLQNILIISLLFKLLALKSTERVWLSTRILLIKFQVMEDMAIDYFLKVWSLVLVCSPWQTFFLPLLLSSFF